MIGTEAQIPSRAWVVYLEQVVGFPQVARVSVSFRPAISRQEHGAVGPCRFTESGASAVRRRTLRVEGSKTGVPVAESHCSESCLLVFAVAIAELTAAVVAYDDRSRVTLMLSLPVSVLNTLLGKNSRHRIHVAPEFHKSIRSLSPARVELMRLSCLPVMLTFSAWPESLTLRSPVSKSNLFNTVPESKELPVTEETLKAFCLALSSVFVAFALYADS